MTRKKGSTDAGRLLQKRTYIVQEEQNVVQERKCSHGILLGSPATDTAFDHDK